MGLVDQPKGVKVDDRNRQRRFRTYGTGYLRGRFSIPDFEIQQRSPRVAQQPGTPKRTRRRGKGDAHAGPSAGRALNPRALMEVVAWARAMRARSAPSSVSR